MALRLRLRHQRLLAEGVAALQLGQHHLRAAHQALDLEAPGFDHVVVSRPRRLRWITTSPRCGLDALEALQQLVDVRRRQLRERAAAQVGEREGAGDRARASLRTARAMVELPSPRRPPPPGPRWRGCRAPRRRSTSRSTSVIALVRDDCAARRFSAWRCLAAAADHHQRAAAPRTRAAARPRSRNTDCAAAACAAASGSLPRAARSTTATSASSARRSCGQRRRAAPARELLGVARSAGRRCMSGHGSELEHQVVLQHARPDGAGALLDLRAWSARSRRASRWVM